MKKISILIITIFTCFSLVTGCTNTNKIANFEIVSGTYDLPIEVTDKQMNKIVKALNSYSFEGKEKTNEEHLEEDCFEISYTKDGLRYKWGIRKTTTSVLVFKEKDLEYNHLTTDTQLLNEICEDLEYRVNKLRIVEKELTIRKFDILWKEGYEEYKLREDYLSYCFLDFFDNVLSDNKLTNLYCDHINISEGYKMKFDYFNKNNLSFPDLAFYKHLDKKAKELFSTFDIFEEDDEIIKTQIFQFKKRS